MRVHAGIFLTIPLSVLPGSARLPMGGRSPEFATRAVARGIERTRSREREIWVGAGRANALERSRRGEGERAARPTKAGLTAVSDTGRTPTRLPFDIIGLFPLLRPPIREHNTSTADINSLWR